MTGPPFDGLRVNVMVESNLRATTMDASVVGKMKAYCRQWKRGCVLGVGVTTQLRMLVTPDKLTASPAPGEAICEEAEGGGQAHRRPIPAELFFPRPDEQSDGRPGPHGHGQRKEGQAHDHPGVGELTFARVVRSLGCNVCDWFSLPVQKISCTAMLATSAELEPMITLPLVRRSLSDPESGVLSKVRAQ